MTRQRCAFSSFGLRSGSGNETGTNLKQHKYPLLCVYRPMIYRIPLMLCIVFCLMSTAISQSGGFQSGGFYAEPDTVPEIEYEYVPTEKANIFAGRPGKAALYSLILPGAGQAYNKKYWQVPIVWAGVYTVGFFMSENTKSYKKYRDAYRERLLAALEERPPIEDEEFTGARDEQIRNERDRWDRYRQMTIFGFALVWIANSAQAYVGAHLKEFDVSDDLSLEFVPFSGNEIHQENEFNTQFNTQPPTLFSSAIVLRF